MLAGNGLDDAAADDAGEHAGAAAGHDVELAADAGQRRKATVMLDGKAALASGGKRHDAFVSDKRHVAAGDGGIGQLVLQDALAFDAAAQRVNNRCAAQLAGAGDFTNGRFGPGFGGELGCNADRKIEWHALRPCERYTIRISLIARQATTQWRFNTCLL